MDVMAWKPGNIGYYDIDIRSYWNLWHDIQDLLDSMGWRGGGIWNYGTESIVSCIL